MKKFITQLAKIYRDEKWAWVEGVPDEIDIACDIIDKLKYLMEHKEEYISSGGIVCSYSKEEGVGIRFEKEYHEG